jgi:tetratricopeptide (TPR) repeat protein
MMAGWTLAAFAALVVVTVAWLATGQSEPQVLAEQLLRSSPEQSRDLLDTYSRKACVQALVSALKTLSLDDRLAERPDLVEALVELDPAAGLGAAADLAELGTPGLARRACAALLREQPGHVLARQVLVELQLRAGDLDGAEATLARGDRQEPKFVLLRIRILFERGERQAATELLQQLGRQVEVRRRGDLGFVDPYWAGVGEEVERLREMLLRELEGDEAVLRDAVASGKLAPRSGVNHSLVGAAAMSRSERIAERLELQPVALALAEAQRVLSRDPTVPWALLRAGEAHLRIGDWGDARKLFRELVEQDPSYFPGQLGLGAVLTLEEHRAEAALRELPDDDPDPAWGPIIPDLPVLTRDERRVVAASASPLRRALPGLLAAGAWIRLLPLDVRPTDVPELARLQGQRLDTRAVAGLTGLASSEGYAIARIEGLLDTCSPGSWVFAHELAHLAFWFLPEPEQRSFEALYEAERSVAWAFTEYQRQNVDEFFAVSYADWLRERHGQRVTPADSEGAWARVSAWFDQLAR